MPVEHDIANHRFVIHLPTGDGQLVYAMAGPQLLDLQHTEVDEHLRGQGIGNQIVTGAMEYARRNNLKVIPTCPFVRTWAARHPEYPDLIQPRR